MRTFDALWIAYRASTLPTWVYVYKAIINGVTYTEAEIWGFSKTGALAGDNFGIGNCPIQLLTVSVVAKAGVTIPKNARAEIQVQITGASGATLWHSLGVFFIDARKALAGGKLEFSCLDRMAYADVPYLTDGETLAAYPMPMDTAMTRIYTQLGTTLDARCTISHTMTIEYPNDLTMRQVLAFIALAHGGNFCITEDDKLRLVIPSYSGSALAAIDGSNAVKTFAGNTPITWDSLSMVYTEAGDYYTSGTTHNAELEVTMPWATQAMCDAVQAIINGYTYTPYTANQADLDPAIELGDHITIDGVACNVWAWKWNNRLYCDISIPSSTDTTTSEFGYTGTLTGALSKKVTLGASYFGTQISRDAGLKISRSDGASEVLLNSMVMAMRALSGGEMVDKLYFDPALGTFVFDGEVTARALTISGDSTFASGYNPSLKKTVFTNEPTTPYSLGDLWAAGSTGDLKRCTTARATGAYAAGDWTLATKYTDNTAANAAAADALTAHNLADAAQAAAVAADAVADTALANAATAQTAANTAQTQANLGVTNAATANGLLADLASDNKLTAVEKQTVKKDWDSIVSEVALNDTQATTFGITTEKTTYDNAYSALSTYITPLLTNLATTSDIVGTTFRSTFKTYYDALTALLNAIANKARTNAAAAQTTANTAVTNAATAQTRADLGVTNAATAQSKADTAFTNAATAQTQATLGVTNAATAQTQANLGVTNAATAKTQADLGVANAAIAKTQADLGVTNAATAQTTATNAQGSATTANNLLADLASDNKLTAVEKQVTKKEWDGIVSEKVLNDAQATTFGITTEKTNYGTAYTTLSNYITPLLANLTTTSDITGTTFRVNFKDYYDKLTALLNAIAAKAKTLADTAQTQATLGVTNAATAQTQATLGVTNAATAQTQANLGVTNAATAKTQADLGVSNAAAAQTQADLGVANAAAAQAAANTAQADIDALAPAGLIELAKLGTTLIVGGYIKTGLIIATNIVAGILSSTDGKTFFDLDLAKIVATTRKALFQYPTGTWHYEDTKTQLYQGLLQVETVRDATSAPTAIGNEVDLFSFKHSGDAGSTFANLLKIQAAFRAPTGGAFSPQGIDVSNTGIAEGDDGTPTPIGANTIPLRVWPPVYLMQMPKVNGDLAIESGNNANGNYTKFADGTMICTRKTGLIITDTINNGISFGYQSNLLWAAEFYVVPIVSVGIEYNSGIPFGARLDVITATKITTVFLVGRPIVGESGYVNLTATGRWKA